jgi:hypothetical protein
MGFDFNEKVEWCLDVMENCARDIGVKGVAVLAWLAEENGIQWIGRMRVIDMAFAEVPNEKGYNCIGIAWSKAAEMMATKQNSGTMDRVYMNGEVGYQGGAINKIGNGYLAAAFSGAASDVDFKISLAGIKAFQTLSFDV